MNTWSEATITPVAPGPDGREDSAGARRRVSVPAFGFRSQLEEEAVESEPPARFVYRVIAGGATRNHRGEITLTNAGDQTVVVWSVRFDGALPGLDRVLGAILRPRLARSLDKLESVLRNLRSAT